MVVAAACGPPTHGPPDGGPPLALEVLDPPGAQIGLHYGHSIELRVRYHTDDAAAAPVAGQTVRFSIFADPAGSTLARDRAVTDASGVASVTLTAGQAEASFRVRAQANNAPDAEFDVSVSKLDFVELAAALSWPAGDPATTTLRALLYDDRGCAALPAAPTQPAPFRAFSSAGTNEATITFQKLLSKRYALVGRAEDADDHLVGYGCVDIGAELIPPGSVSTVPVPLLPAVASPVATLSLTSSLRPAVALRQPVLQPWQTFGGCVYGAAQMLLDAMGLGGDTTDRDAPGGDGCRPMSATSLDRQLQDLLTAPAMAPADQLAGIAGDLDAITATVQLASQLTIAPDGGGGFVGAHALQQATFRTAMRMGTYDLHDLGLPLVDVANIPIADDGATLTLGTHGLTLGWTTLWKRAFVELSLTARIPSLAAPEVPSLVSLVVGAAARSGKTGCAAVDDLVCSVTTGSGSCTLATPCASALGPLAATLEAPLSPASGVDLTLRGTAQPVDDDADLAVDRLAGGAWSAPELSPAPGDNTFTGTRP